MSLRHARKLLEKNKSEMPSDSAGFLLNRALVQLSDGLIEEFDRLHTEIAALKASLQAQRKS